MKGNLQLDNNSLNVWFAAICLENGSCGFPQYFVSYKQSDKDLLRNKNKYACDTMTNVYTKSGNFILVSSSKEMQNHSLLEFGCLKFAKDNILPEILIYYN